ncbi:MAG TPA: hypothetical protein ENJ09_13600 [Planctomycetes bacterium]|nr:hypothetical protein [Planctomycetota bacterium]
MRKDRQTIETLLGALGDHMSAENLTASLLVVGGAALVLRGFVPRVTQDVDVLGMQVGRSWMGACLSEELEALIHRVARDFSVREDWLNTEVASQWRMGLPPGFERDLRWMHFGPLRVALAGRSLLISLKLFAAVDAGVGSVHLQDLRALAPSTEELERARDWVREQDASPHFPRFLDEVIRHVQRSD